MDRTPCFHTLAANAHLKAQDRADAALEQAVNTLHAELLDGWKKSPLTKVQTPDHFQSESTVQEVVADYLDGVGAQFDADRLEVLQLIVDAAKGQDVAGRCKAFMERVADYHAKWHAEAYIDHDGGAL